MAELTPHLIEGLMSNIPPQQDFRRAVTIVSADPAAWCIRSRYRNPDSVPYRIVAAKYCASACSYQQPSSPTMRFL